MDREQGALYQIRNLVSSLRSDLREIDEEKHADLKDNSRERFVDGLPDILNQIDDLLNVANVPKARVASAGVSGHYLGD